MTDYGIDVSHWNAVTDAQAVRGNGITFAWCKATEGSTYVDPTFGGKANQLRAAGITVGAYHFLRGGEVARQAAHFKGMASIGGCLRVGSLAPMLDLESSEVRGNANEAVIQFYDALGIGGPMLVYGNLDWWSKTLDPNVWGGRSIFGHIARYNGDPGRPGWTYPRMAVHQHTNAGSVPGIPGSVDRDATMPGYSLLDLTLGGVVVVPTPTPTPPPVDNREHVVVKSGDTLSAIAARWGVTVSAVANANHIANPDRIFPGQIIYRPSGNTPAPKPAGRYQIRSGDTLGAIARSHGTTVAVLVALNHISNPDRIYAGQWLTLPG